jgi:hypothetical protein
MLKTTLSHTLSCSLLGLGALALSACSAQSYGHGGSYAGANCTAAMTQMMAQNCAGYGAYGASQGAYSGAVTGKSRYGTSYEVAGYQQQLYAQQHYQQQMMMLRPAPIAQPSYSYQAQSYQTASVEPSYNVELFDQPTTTTSSYASTPASCPAGTTPQSDGTCLQGSTTSYSSYTSTPSYSSTSSYTGGYVTSGAPLNCPAGTTASSDGTCLEGGSSSYIASSPNYSTSSTTRAVAPALSTYDWDNSDTTWGSNNYVSPGSRVVDAPNVYPSVDTPAPTYAPYRK